MRRARKSPSRITILRRRWITFWFIAVRWHVNLFSVTFVANSPRYQFTFTQAQMNSIPKFCNLFPLHKMFRLAENLKLAQECHRIQHLNTKTLVSICSLRFFPWVSVNNWRSLANKPPIYIGCCRSWNFGSSCDARFDNLLKLLRFRGVCAVLEMQKIYPKTKLRAFNCKQQFGGLIAANAIYSLREIFLRDAMFMGFNVNEISSQFNEVFLSDLMSSLSLMEWENFDQARCRNRNKQSCQSLSASHKFSRLAIGCWKCKQKSKKLPNDVTLLRHESFSRIRSFLSLFFSASSSTSTQRWTINHSGMCTQQEQEIHALRWNLRKLNFWNFIDSA